MRIFFPVTFYFFLLFITASCTQQEEYVDTSNAIARVGTKYLYIDDIRSVFPPDLNNEESLFFLKNYVDRWIRKQVLLDQSEKSLSEKQRDFSAQLEAYKNTMQINKFEQLTVEKNLDTLISEDELQSFYEAHKNEFKLKESILNPLFVRIPKKVKNLAQVKMWYKSSREEDIEKLVKFTFTNKGDFFYENDEWYDFSDFFKKIPIETGPSDEQFLLYNKNIELQDSVDYYFISIKDYKLRKDVPPLAYAKNQVKSMILNKRKINLINELHVRLSNEAMSEKFAEIFSKDLLELNTSDSYSDTLKKISSKK